jgi:hypothetical protein
MNNPHCVGIVLITPASKWVTVCEHDQALGLDVLFFQIVEDSIKICTTATFDFVITDAIQVVAVVLLLTVA